MGISQKRSSVAQLRIAERSTGDRRGIFSLHWLKDLGINSSDFQQKDFIRFCRFREPSEAQSLVEGRSEGEEENGKTLIKYIYKSP